MTGALVDFREWAISLRLDEADESQPLLSSSELLELDQALEMVFRPEDLVEEVAPKCCHLRRMARIDYPTHLKGAVEFSADRLGSTWFVREFRKSEFWPPLEKEIDEVLTTNWGRRRNPGEWALAFIGFTMSHIVDIEPWWSETNDEFWQACGFALKPPYQTAYERFVELEKVSDKFRDAAAELIAFARAKQPAIGRHVHIDSTEAETHSGFVHDCQEGDNCPGVNNIRPLPPQIRHVPKGQGQLPGKGRSSRRKTRLKGGARIPRKLSTAAVREKRQEALEKGLSDNPLELPDNQIDKVEYHAGYMRVKSGAHWYRTRDKTCGARSYTGQRGVSYAFWAGFYNMKVVDHYTGARLATGVFPANRQEYVLLPNLYGLLERALGVAPQTIVADRGFATKDVYEFLTTRGVAGVMPWRIGVFTGGPTRGAQDHETHDRHGVPRCKHCGAETRFVRFHANNGKPRMWFHCVLEPVAECQKDQSISCSEDWRLLRPLWETDEIFQNLLASHQRYERVHHHTRQRFDDAGKDVLSRPKRIGRAWQQLRADASLVVEWFRICWRHGWLPGSKNRNLNAERRFRWKGEHGVANVLAERAGALLHIPYGKQAAKRGFGQASPPSRRTPPANGPGGSAAATP